MSQMKNDEKDSETLYRELASMQQQNRSLELEIGKLRGRLRLARSLGLISSANRINDPPSVSSLTNLKQMLLRVLLFLQCPSQPTSIPTSDERTWYYIDGSQRRHGPFRTSEMNEWRQYFHPRQHVSCTPLGRYVTFGDAFSESSSFSVSPHDLQLTRCLLLEFLKPH